jgi:predicted dehydrogenase
MFHVALVGFGYWGRKIFNAASDASSGIVVRCVVDADRKALGECRGAFRVYTSIDEALEREKDLAAVVIATPIHTHYEIAMKCLRMGMDVFVEKPVCVTRDELDALEYTAGTTNSKIYCDYTIATSDKIEALKNVVGDERILHVDFRWESSPRVTNDNVVHDLFPHIVSIADALSPGAFEVKSAQKVESGGAIVKAVMTMTSGGVQMSATVSWLESRKVRSVKVLTPTRTIEYDDSSDVVLVTPYRISTDRGAVHHERLFHDETVVANRVEPLVKTLRTFSNGDVFYRNSNVTRSVVEAFERIERL